MNKEDEPKTKSCDKCCLCISFGAWTGENEIGNINHCDTLQCDVYENENVCEYFIKNE